MAYANSLTDEKSAYYYHQLGLKIEAESSAAYESNLRKAKSKKAKDQCAGSYQGSWYRLREDWLANKVSNLHIQDCLRIGRVIGDSGVKFVPAGRLKTSSRKKNCQKLHDNSCF